MAMLNVNSPVMKPGYYVQRRPQRPKSEAKLEDGWQTVQELPGNLDEMEAIRHLWAREAEEPHMEYRLLLLQVRHWSSGRRRFSGAAPNVQQRPRRG